MAALTELKELRMIVPNKDINLEILAISLNLNAFELEALLNIC